MGEELVVGGGGGGAVVAERERERERPNPLKYTVCHLLMHAGALKEWHEKTTRR